MSKRGYAASKKLLTGLIGAPIAHSASPAMHERAAELSDFAMTAPPISASPAALSIRIPT